MVIEGVRLLAKSGGKSGEWRTPKGEPCFADELKLFCRTGERLWPR